MKEIEFDFQIAKIQIQKLEETANKMEKITFGAYTNAMLELMQGWQSEGSQKIQDKGCALREKMVGTTICIRQAAEALYKATEKAKCIEAKAKEIAEKRTIK